MLRRVRHLAVPGLFVILTTLVRAGDVPKSADHPLVKRYEGSTIVAYSQKAFDEYRLVIGPVVGRGDKAHFPKTRALEGRVTHITYLVPEGRSTLEVIRNYELELKKAGFTTLFAGAHEGLGEGKFDTAFADTRYSDIAMPSSTRLTFASLASARRTIGMSPHSWSGHKVRSTSPSMR